jgi:hypothetical protein
LHSSAGVRGLLVLLVLAAAACGAAPQRKVAVLGVERANGANDAEYEDWLTERVDRDYDVVRVDAPAELTEKKLRKVAKRADAVAVVYGELSKKKKGRMWLTVRVHDGRSGELIETHEISIKRGKVNSKHEKRFARELFASLVIREPEPAPEAKPKKRDQIAEPEPEPEPEPAAEPEREPEPEPEIEEPEPSPPPKSRSKAKTAVKIEDKKPAFEAAEEPVRTKYTDSGQALDDEMPDSLKKK